MWHYWTKGQQKLPVILTVPCFPSLLQLQRRCCGQHRPPLMRSSDVALEGNPRHRSVPAHCHTLMCWGTWSRTWLHLIQSMWLTWSPCSVTEVDTTPVLVWFSWTGSMWSQPLSADWNFWIWVIRVIEVVCFQHDQLCVQRLTLHIRPQLWQQLTPLLGMSNQIYLFLRFHCSWHRGKSL